jgi:ribosomal protein S18 acetylase RimI-like enzyme
MVTIRNGEYNDIEQIMLLDKECFGIDIEPINSEKNKKMLYSKNFWEYLLKQAYRFLVVCDGTQVVGTIVVTKETKPETFAIRQIMQKHNIQEYYLIVSICIAKNYRGTGISEELLRRAIKNITGYVILNVRTLNTKAINFYKKFNFEISEFVDKGYYNNPVDDGLVMFIKK